MSMRQQRSHHLDLHLRASGTTTLVFLSLVFVFVSLLSLPTTLADIAFVQQTTSAPWRHLGGPLLTRIPFNVTYTSATASSPSSPPVMRTAPPNSLVLTAIDATARVSVFISTDSGATWDTVLAIQSLYDDWMRSGSSFASTPVSATLYNIGGFNNPYAVWRSTDGGATWSNVSTSDPSQQLIPRYQPLLVVSRAGTIVVAGGYTSVGEAIHSIQASFDGGVTMSQTGDAFPDNCDSLFFVDSTVSHATDQVLVCINSWAGRTWFSTDLGAHWLKADRGTDSTTHHYRPALVVTPDNVVVRIGGYDPDHAQSVLAVRISLDAGVNWIDCGKMLNISPREYMPVGLNAAGYLVIAGGLRRDSGVATPYQDAWLSTISFHDLTQLSNACGGFVIPARGIGYQGPAGDSSEPFFVKWWAVIVAIVVATIACAAVSARPVRRKLNAWRQARAARNVIREQIEYQFMSDPHVELRSAVVVGHQ